MGGKANPIQYGILNLYTAEQAFATTSDGN